MIGSSGYGRITPQPLGISSSFFLLKMIIVGLMVKKDNDGMNEQDRWGFTPLITAT